MQMKPTSYNMRAHVIRLMQSAVTFLLIVEIIVLFVDYFTHTMDTSVMEYVFKYIIPPFAWNISMCVLLRCVNASSKFDEEQKTKYVIFIITKICACVAIIHSYYLPTQCVFIIAIIMAALISDTKRIIFTTIDSVAMLFISVLLSFIFSPTWPFWKIFESAIMSSILLLFTGTLAQVVSKYRIQNDMLIQQYMVELERATHNAKLDMMTGLYHHAEFYNILYSLITKEKNKLSVAIMDIDNFKSINDTYGHDNGDKVILAIAERVKAMNNDNTVFVSRYGGEEFAFIFINVAKKKVIEELQAIRKEISDLRFDFDENKVITMSGGLFECYTCTYTVENVFNNADTALYYAKEHGRNQLIVYNELEKSGEEFSERTDK